MGSVERNLPQFDAPPVVETLLGVEFAPLARWDIRHFGLLWQEIKRDFPQFLVKPPLPPRVEKASAEAELAQNLFVKLIAETGPKVRCWFIDKTESRLLQLQDDRFIHNWRQVSEGQRYPRYHESVRPTFIEEWNRFEKFLQSNDIAAPDVRHWEVTYINHLERGREWHDLADLPRVFRFWRGHERDGLLPLLDGFQMHLRYALPEAAGHLHVSMQPGVRNRDGKEILQLKLTATGPNGGSELSTILSRLDLGHEWVVRTFTDLTSPEMHNLWRRSDRP